MTMPPRKLVLGRIDYLNCRPLYTALQRLATADYFTLVVGNPAELNHGLKTGTVELSPSSSILPATDPEHRYFHLPGIAIVSLLQVQSVLLLSRKEPEQLEGARITLTGHSLTSIYLLKIILGRFYRLDLRHIEFTTGEFDMPKGSSPKTECDAALVIGDRALRFHHHPPAGYQVYDLGRLWHDFTALPFVYALWLGRCDLKARKKEQLERLHSDLEEICRRLPEQLEPLSRAAAAESGFTAAEILSYWQEAISYRYDDAAAAGLQCFYRLAAELKLIPKIPVLVPFP